MLWETVQPITERKAYGRTFLFLAVLTASLAALSFYRFVRIWWNTNRLLERLDNASPELAKAFEGISEELDWKPMKSFGMRIPSFKVLALSAARLADLKLSKINQTALRKELEEVFKAEADGFSGDELRHRQSVEEIFKTACEELRNRIGMLGARDFLALRVAAYLRYVFAHLRGSLLGALGTGLLLLGAVTTYAFEPKQFVSLALWLALAVAVILTFWIFLQMDRNATLSRIGGTDVGQITFDRTFYVKLFLYTGVPVLGLIATQFPGIGRLLGQLADQLFRVAGGG